ncbi:UNVERIFIED_CONTAM: ABC-type lipoprotein release transport system permease subunit [Acetivibrio alkalicellulosi]
MAHKQGVVELKSIFLMAFANIKRRKTQSILIGIIIMVSSLIFSTAVGLLFSLNKPFETMQENQNASHILIMFDNKIHNASKVSEWWMNNTSVTGVTGIMPYHSVNESPIHNGNKLNTMINLSELPSDELSVDTLYIVEGDKKPYPEFDEVWIPTSFAYGSNIKIGDTFSIPVYNGTRDFVVSAIVVDPIFSTNFINPTRVWISPGHLPFLFPASRLDSVHMGIQLEDPTAVSKLWAEFEEYLGVPFSGLRLDHELIKFSFVFLYLLIGAILLIFSILIILVTFYIISSTIASSIISDYKTIGILKAQGLTPGDLVTVYVTQYTILSSVFILSGVTLSIFAVKTILQTLTRSLGIIRFDLQATLPLLLLSFLFLFALTLVIAYLNARKAGKVKPAEAIRYGAPSKKYHKANTIKVTSMGKLPLSMIIGIKQLLSQKRQAAFLLIIFFLTSFVLTFSVNGYNSISKMPNNLSLWGFDESHVYIERSGKRITIDHNELMDELSLDERVKSVVPLSWIITGVVPEDQQNPSMNIIGVAYEGDMSSINLINLEGINPQNQDEISIATNTAKKYNKKIGDDFELFIEGKKIIFKVTGIYQSMSNLGQGYRIQTSAVKNVNPLFEPSSYAVLLNNPKDSERFIYHYENLFGEAVELSLTTEFFGEMFDEVTMSMGAALAFIAVIFVIVLIAIIINSTLLGIHRHKKNYGIYKSFGMTPFELRLSILYKNLAAGIPSILLGVPISLYISPKIVESLLSQMGVIKFPVTVHVSGTVAAMIFCLLVCIISTWVSSGQVLKISPKILVSE